MYLYTNNNDDYKQKGHLDYMDNSGLLQTMLGQSDVPKRSRTVQNDPRPEISEEVFFWDTLYGRSPFDI